jgi:regulator of RNase E activity RraA
MNAIEAELLERCSRIGTSTWSDALDEFGINGVIREIRHRSGQGRFAGMAVTAREASGRLGDYPRHAFAVAEMVGAIGPGQVLMVDMDGADVSTFGGMAALAVVMRGAAAVVIDGACRDVEDIQATGLWLASRFATPTSGKRRVKLESLGEPVTVGGVKVQQGDVVIGDKTGIVVVPKDDLERVLAESERMLALDRQIEGALRAGKSFAEATAAADYI